MSDLMEGETVYAIGDCIETDTGRLLWVEYTRAVVTRLVDPDPSTGKDCYIQIEDTEVFCRSWRLYKSEEAAKAEVARQEAEREQKEAEDQEGF